MSSFSPSNSVVRFGMFELSPSSGELRKAGLTVKLQPQPFKVLALLVGRAGEVVRRHEIQERVWGGETHVDFEPNLNFCIKQVRSALGDDAKVPRYIETLPKLGYRFIAPVEQTGKTVLAVLPFVNLSADADEEYFSDGLTEELITRLAGVQPRKLGVIARASVMRFKKTERPITIKEIGQALGADYVVEGSVRRAGSRFRITAQLIQVADETHLWADSYDGDYEVREIFDIQDQVSRAVANKLRIKLVDEQARTPSRPTESVEAYELYRKGVYHLDKFTAEAMQKSITYFDKLDRKMLITRPRMPPLPSPTATWLSGAGIRQESSCPRRRQRY